MSSKQSLASGRWGEVLVLLALPEAGAGDDFAVERLGAIRIERKLVALDRRRAKLVPMPKRIGTH
jgi:hypothetical protein